MTYYVNRALEILDIRLLNSGKLFMLQNITHLNAKYENNEQQEFLKLPAPSLTPEMIWICNAYNL